MHKIHTNCVFFDPLWYATIASGIIKFRLDFNLDLLKLPLYEYVCKPDRIYYKTNANNIQMKTGTSICLRLRESIICFVISMDEDYALALQLQADFLGETHSTSHQSHDKVVPSNHGPEPQSLVDPFWEMTDPNPDVRALFVQFNERFFWGRLAGIEVRWSPRMTL